MQILGDGFIAKHLEPLDGLHPDVVALASGVSHPHNTEAAYRREFDLVSRTLERCKNDGKTLIFFSSAAIYGGPGCRGREDDPAHPPTRYGAHKLALEGLIRESGVRYLCLRLGYVLGRHAPEHRLIPSLIDQIRHGEVTVYRNTRRDLIHAEDMVEILDALLRSTATNEVVNVASGRCVLIDDIIDHLEDRLGLRAQRVFKEDRTTHCLSLEKVRSFLPDGINLDFPAHYYQLVIDSYLIDTKRKVRDDVTLHGGPWIRRRSHTS